MLFLNTSLSLTSFKLNRYNPLINYDWSTTTTSGLRYLKDVGSTPTYNASMYFGIGAYFNGVDQSIDYGTLATTSAEVSMVFRGNSVICCHKYNFWTVRNGFQYYLADGSTLVVESILFDSTKTYTLNITPTLIELFENGVKILTKIPKSLLNGGAKTIGSRYTTYTSSIIKDLFMFNRTLTQAEITQSYEQPEAFYAMAQDDSTCVLNMPMCETDKYVRNMKSYTIGGVNLFTSGLSVAGGIPVTDITNGYRVTKTSLESVSWIALTNTVPVTDTIIKIGFNFNLVSGSEYPLIVGTYTSEGSNNLSTPYQVKEGYNELVVQSWANKRLAYLQIKSITSTFTWDFTNIIVNALSGVYPITNYTSSVRDNAKNLQYGLQTCKFVRDSLGVIQSASDYLECDGVGYGNTGWNSGASEEKTIEYIVKELLITSTNFQNIITDGKLSTNLYSRFNDNKTNKIGTNIGGNGYTEVTFNNVVHITIVLKTNGYELFKDGVSQGFKNAKGSIPELTDVIIGTDVGRTSTLSSPIRLFKVHSKALTQAEITKNYNSYVAKGLLT